MHNAIWCSGKNQSWLLAGESARASVAILHCSANKAALGLAESNGNWALDKLQGWLDLNGKVNGQKAEQAAQHPQQDSISPSSSPVSKYLLTIDAHTHTPAHVPARISQRRPCPNDADSPGILTHVPPDFTWHAKVLQAMAVASTLTSLRLQLHPQCTSNQAPRPWKI